MLHNPRLWDCMFKVPTTQGRQYLDDRLEVCRRAMSFDCRGLAAEHRPLVDVRRFQWPILLPNPALPRGFVDDLIGPFTLLLHDSPFLSVLGSLIHLCGGHKFACPS